ncbi:ephrin-A3-like [Neopelma chrysocephalum]|uniref:ephrin-A3-like n=1 Tax=Neopelma chrysocephalum TaxID=114329 RepID=UPI000FCD1BAE|nr:ephrin-A3-like [Neopelma chrysocephalum]
MGVLGGDGVGWRMQDWGTSARLGCWYRLLAQDSGAGAGAGFGVLLHSPSPEHTPGQDQTPPCPDPLRLGVPGAGVTTTEPPPALSCLAATPTHNHRRACLKMKVFVCCASTSHSGEKLAPTLPQFTLRPEVKIEDLENFNPEMPKLEKSISGTSPKREHLPLAVAAALFLMTLLAS